MDQANACVRCSIAIQIYAVNNQTDADDKSNNSLASAQKKIGKISVVIQIITDFLRGNLS